MDTKDVKRKLRAILSADVQGYSRLMGDDEVATVKTITEYRETLGSLINQYKGRVVDSPGDNVLAEFGSVVDAAQCAVEIQNILKAKNEDLPENRRMIFRIGVNLGDVIQEGDRIYGDGVNIAARIESLADGGGICISGTAYDQIKNKLALGYDYLGEHSVKNISEPVRVYKVPMDPKDVGKKRGGKSWKKIAITAAVLLILAGAAATIWNFYLRPDVEPASIEKMAYPLPDKPSIAVLPFVNMSGDPEQEYFSDGLTEDIITALSKIPKLFIIARNSTFTYKNKPVKIQKVAEELGVRYVLEGSVRSSEDRIRITAQLIDAITGYHIWAESYDRKIGDIFALQDEITKQILTAMQVKLTEGEMANLVSKGTNNIKAYIKAVQSIEHFRSMKRDENIRSRQAAEEAIALDPKYALAWSMLAWTDINDVLFGWSKSPKKSIEQAIKIAKKCSKLGSSDRGHYLMSSIYLITKQYEKAITEVKEALALLPNVSDINAFSGLLHNYSNKPEEALGFIQKAMRLNPHYPSWYLNQLAISYRLTGRYDEALAANKSLLARNETTFSFFAHIGLALTYIHLGREKEAHAQVEDILKMRPDYNLEYFAKHQKQRYKDKAYIDRSVDAMRRAGLPETPPLPLPDKPSIAVLPFANISGDPKEDYLSDGITEQIITALSKTPKLFVIARNSVFTYKGKPVKVQQVSKDLGVRYVLEGSVQKSGDRIRITAQLIDAKTGNHLWAEKFDRDLKDIFALQDDIAMNIITALQVKLTEGEQTRIYRRHTNNIEAYLNLLKAREHMYRHTKQDFLITRRLLKEAIALDPNYTTSYEFLGQIHLMEVMGGWSPSPGKSLKRTFELSQKILELDSSNAPVHGLLSTFYNVKKQYGKAISEAEKFIALDPNDADAYAFMGYALFGAGRFRDSVSMFDKAMALNPIPPTWYLVHLGLASFFAGLNDEANAVFRKLIFFHPKYGSGYTYLGLTLIADGKPEEAVMEFDKALNLKAWFEGIVIGNRAVALVGIGKTEEAITTMQDFVSRRPDDAYGYMFFSEVLGFEGRHKEALEMAKKAVSLRHEAPDSGVLGFSYFMLEQYDQAIAEFRQSLKLWPDYMFGHIGLTASYGLAGRMENARAQAAEVLKINPRITLEDIAKNGYYNYKKADKERFISALRKAGLK